MLRVFLRSVLAPALQLQIVISLGFLASFALSLYYYFSPHGYPPEQPLTPLLFSIISGLLAIGGYVIQKFDPPKSVISLRRGAWIVLFVWLISVCVTAAYFTIMGAPAPDIQMGFWTRYINGLYEALSGFTTTGASILPSVEIFPRSFLFFRALTHWLGGMGLAYLGVTIWKTFKSSREAIINSESESPDVVTYQNNDEARQSGLDFLKAYAVVSSVLLLALLISGQMFRHIPYPSWSDNFFDSLTHTFSVMGTGGFSTYDKSAGLPLVETGQIIPGGLRNPVSEWIIAFFMMFAGMNFSLWYMAIFTRKGWKSVWKNRELQAYLGIIFIASGLIAFILKTERFYPSLEQNLRYAFFNVTTIISTTGLGNWDFLRWPAGALGILFVCFLIGGMVGSTAGGPKVSRFIITYKFLKQQIQNFVYGTEESSFSVDGSIFDVKKAGLVVASVALYYFIFLAGGILLLVFSSSGQNPDGSLAILDFGTAMAASIANLGNIGPAINAGQGLNVGPTGNYFAFTNAGKIILIVLMYIGRVGVLTFLMLGLRTRGEARLVRSVAEIKFDPNNPALHR